MVGGFDWDCFVMIGFEMEDLEVNGKGFVIGGKVEVDGLFNNDGDFGDL